MKTGRNESVRRVRGRYVVGASFALVLLGWVGAAPLRAQDLPSLLERRARLTILETPLPDGLRALQRASGAAIAFSVDLLPRQHRVGCDCGDVTVEEALRRMLEGTGLIYRDGGRQVLVGRPSAAMEASPDGAPAVLAGVVVEEGSGRPVPAAEVRAPDGRSVVTGADGRFLLRDPLPTSAPWRLDVEALGYAPSQLVVDPSTATTLRVELQRAPIRLSEIVIAPGAFGILEAAPTAAGLTVSREDIEATPQIGDDVFRTLKRMPGVSTDDISTRLSVRGGTPRDVLVRLDGLTLYEPYHLKDLDGALGIVDVQSLGSIDLVTGGFPVDFGGRTAAVFDMRSRRPPVSGARTTLGLSLSSASAISQGTFAGDRGQWLASLRRGFLEYVLAVTDADEGIKPDYWDVLARTQYLLGDGHVLSAQILYAGDHIRWSDEETGAEVRSRWTNGYAWLDWSARLGRRLELGTQLSTGRLTRQRDGDVARGGGAFSPLTADVTDRAEHDFAGIRQDLTFDLTEGMLLKAGAEVRSGAGSYGYRGYTTRYAVDPDGGLYVAEDSTVVDTAPDGTELAAWAALRGRVGPVTWEGGVRHDRYSHTGDAEWSPRLLLRWDSGTRTTIRTSWGRYVQGHALHELQAQDGQSTFEGAEVARQWAAGVEHALPDGWSLRAEAYVRRTRDPLPEFVSLSREVTALPEVESDRTAIVGDRARAHGLELMVGREHTGPVSWWASYALAWSERRVDGRWRPRTLDQRHTLNLGGAWRMGPDWQLSASWHYHTGWPFTDQTLRVRVAEDPDVGDDVEVLEWTFGALNGLRLPSYHRLDLRLTRAFEMSGSRLEVFLDVFNAYNRMNLRGWQWLLRPNGDGTFRTIRDTGAEQLPMMPTLGFRWVF